MSEGGKRSRRTTRYEGQYVAETYSDLDSDNDTGKNKSSSKSKRSSTIGRPRIKECPSCQNNVAISTRECQYCDYQFTGKGIAFSSGANDVNDESNVIRSFFPFEPEREDDGTLIIDKILGRRPSKDAKSLYRSLGQNLADLSANDAKFDYEFLIKYRGVSYLHAEWLSGNDVESLNQRSRKALQRYLNKIDKGDPTAQEDGEIDPTYLEVEKILDVDEQEVQVIIDVHDKEKDAEKVGDKFQEKENGQDTEKDVEKVEEIKKDASEVSDGKSHTEEDKDDEDGAVKDEGNHGNENGTTNVDVDADVDADAEGSTGLPRSSRLPIRPEVEIDIASPDQVLRPPRLGPDGLPEPLSKAQLWGVQTRLKYVLKRIMEDPFAISFIEPVDTESYPDYLEAVEEPICLRDVEARLANKEYKGNNYPRFLSDMRKIWRNCKVYNLYKSQIWWCAHLLSMLTDRLYQAWVMSYQDGSISIDLIKGRPWEYSCRVCNSDKREDKIILCDHCDGQFHIDCLRPKLKKIPEGTWVCPRCDDWLKRTASKNMSAIAEDEVRTLAQEAVMRRLVMQKKKKYLVKWRGLSYKECTWETAKDLDDDELILAFHDLNDHPPPEPPLTQAEIGRELSKERRPYPVVSDPKMVTETQAAVYAQIRAFHFLKWDMIPPEALLQECGAASYAYAMGMRVPLRLPESIGNFLGQSFADGAIVNAELAAEETATTDIVATTETAVEVDEEDDDFEAKKEALKKEVRDNLKLKWMDHVECNLVRDEVSKVLSQAVVSVGRGTNLNPFPARRPLLSCEYEVSLPKGLGSLYMKFGAFNDHTYFLGFKEVDEGIKPYAEKIRQIKSGDIIIEVNGVNVVDQSFKDTVGLITKCKTPFIILRFLRGGDQDMEIAEFTERIARDPSRRLPQSRSRFRGVFLQSVMGRMWMAEAYTDTFHRVSKGPFATQEEAAKAYDKIVAELDAKEAAIAKSKGKPIAAPRLCNFNKDGSLTDVAKAIAKSVKREIAMYEADEKERIEVFGIEEAVGAIEGSGDIGIDSDSDVEETPQKRKALNGNSSPSTAGAVDVDGAGASPNEIISPTYGKKTVVAPDYTGENEYGIPDYNSLDSFDSDSEMEASDSDVSEASDDDWDSDKEDGDGEYKSKKMKESDGPLGRLLKAVEQSGQAPLRSEWNDYILENVRNETDVVNRKIEQIDLVADNTIRIWDSIIGASRSLNIPFHEIKNALDGKTLDGGGFRWKYIATSGTAREDDAQDGKENAWRKKLYKESKVYKSGGKLRDYQVDGLNWLLRCFYQRRSSILADEMGLGKTVQIVSFVEHLFEVENIRGPFLIVVPLSTIEHWKREFDGWSRMNACVYHDVGGGKDMRDVIREYEWYFKNRSRRLLKMQALITTYDDLIRDYEEMSEIPWRVCVVDEAHRLRNNNSKLLECFKTVVSKGQLAYGYQHRILMTGTPLQNNTAELWSLLNFIEPAKFPDSEKFAERFGEIKTQEQVQGLQRRIAPHLLRRVKEDVAKDIPPKEETIIDVELTSAQKQYYRAIFERNHGFLLQSTKGALPKLMNIQMELRKCCNHPFLIAGVEEKEVDELESKQENVASTREQRVKELVIPSSGKMVLLNKLLPKLREEGHKVLIFSQMVRMIEIIEEYADALGYPCEKLTGQVKGNERQKSIDRFNKDKDSFLFLLSTRAGGVGINLTAADTCIIFDSDWNPQNDVQAMARCHRIGQTKDVKIYRLITRRSFEAEMFEAASKKLGLEQAVLGTAEFGAEQQKNEDAKDKDGKIDAGEMEQLLREGAYALLTEENDTELREFCEQDIDQLLAARSHKIVVEGNKQTSSWLNKKRKQGRTRKANFGLAADDEINIDVNDPNFWTKVLPDLVTPEMMICRLKEFEDQVKEHEKLDEDQQVDDDGEPVLAVSEADAKKYMKDLKQMMDGLFDLKSRGQLPERERDQCMQLLLNIQTKEAIFSEDNISKASKWYNKLEGSRNRKSRVSGVSYNESALSKGGIGANGEMDELEAALYAELDEEDDEGQKKKRRRSGPGRGKKGSSGAGSGAGAAAAVDAAYPDAEGSGDDFLDLDVPEKKKPRSKKASKLDIDGNPMKRVRRTKAQIAADKAKEDADRAAGIFVPKRRRRPKPKAAAKSHATGKLESRSAESQGEAVSTDAQRLDIVNVLAGQAAYQDDGNNYFDDMEVSTSPPHVDDHADDEDYME